MAPTDIRLRREVFLFEPTLPHYRLGPWRKLNEALRDKLSVIYRGDAPGNAPADCDYGFRVLPVGGVSWGRGRLEFHQFWKPFKRGNPSVVVVAQNPRIISIFPLLMYCKARRIPVVIRGHGGSRRRSVATGNHPADWVHRWMMRHCDAFVCYTGALQRELEQVVPAERLFDGRNTLDTDELFAVRRRLDREGKQAIRTKLGLTRSHRYVCFIGRLIPEKRLDALLAVLNTLQSSGENVGAVVIGDGPIRKRLESLAAQLSLEDVHFVGELNAPASSGPYLYACDVLVNPGYVGLSVNHALCFGLPVVTVRKGQRGPFHSPEVSYIEHELTGFFAESGSQPDLVEQTRKALSRADAMRPACIKFAEEQLSIDLMVRGHLEAIEYAIKLRG